MPCLFSALAVAWVTGLGLPALAQPAEPESPSEPTGAADPPTVASAQAMMQAGEFEAALAQLDEVEARSRGALGDALELRAVLQFALGNERGMADALEQLASLDPLRVLQPSAPPDVRSAFATAARATTGALAIRVQAERRGQQVLIRVGAANDPFGLGRDPQAEARVGEGTWQVSENGELRLSVAPQLRVAYVAELRGPNGVVLDSRGTRADPVWLEGAAAQGGVVPHSVDDDTITHWVLGVSLAIAVVVFGVGLGVALAHSQRDTVFEAAP